MNPLHVHTKGMNGTHTFSLRKKVGKGIYVYLDYSFQNTKVFVCFLILEKTKSPQALGNSKSLQLKFLLSQMLCPAGLTANSLLLTSKFSQWQKF